jgi:hypothetical protein
MKILKIGDKLFRFVFGFGIYSRIHEFLVIEAHETKHGKQYVVEDQNCTHGWKCQLLIAPTNKNHFKFIRQINDEDNSQEHWHHNNGAGREYFFYTNKHYCVVDVAQYNVSCVAEMLNKAKEGVKKIEEDLDRHEATLKAAQESIEEFETKGIKDD